MSLRRHLDRVLPERRADDAPEWEEPCMRG